MTSDELIRRVRPLLETCMGSRLQGVILYGSEARHEAVPDSDIDLLILLDGPIHLGRDLRVISNLLYPLQLEMPDRPIHTVPVDAAAYRTARFALYQEARAEGVAL